MTATSGAGPSGAGSAAVRAGPADSREALARARELTATLAPSGAAIDLAAADPADALDLLARSGLAALAVPSELGGLWEGPGWVGVGPLLHAMIEIAAGDGNVGQVWSQSLGTACVLFTSPSLPEQARSTLAQELLHQWRQLVTSNAETGTTGKVVARRVADGVAVNGVKSFNTGSGRGGQDLASVGVRLIEGTQDLAAAPPYRALVRLDAPGVRLAGDWDAMGQNSTPAITRSSPSPSRSQTSSSAWADPRGQRRGGSRRPDRPDRLLKGGTAELHRSCTSSRRRASRSSARPSAGDACRALRAPSRASPGPHHLVRDPFSPRRPYPRTLSVTSTFL